MQRMWALLDTSDLCVIEDHENHREIHDRAMELSERPETIAVGVWPHNAIDQRWDNPSVRDGWISVYENGKMKVTLFTAWMQRCDKHRDEQTEKEA